MAMRKHLSVAHPQQYNHELYVETESTNRRQMWTDGELEEMARLEATYSGDGLLDYLADMMGRPRGGLRKKRYNVRYKEMVERFQRSALSEDTSPATPEQLTPVMSNMTRPYTRSQAGQTLTSVPTSMESPTSGVLNAGPRTLASVASRSVYERMPPIAENTSVETDPNADNILEPVPEESEDPVERHLLELCGRSEDADAIAICRSVCRKEDTFKENLDAWTTRLCGLYGRAMRARRGVPSEILTERKGRRRLRAQLYKYTQNKYKTNKKELAREIIDDIQQATHSTTPSKEDIMSHYREIFESPSPPDDLPITDLNKEQVNIYAPIDSITIRETIRAIGKTAAGPDGIDSSRLSRIPLEKIEFLCNMILLSRYIPAPLRHSRTILIAKTKINLDKVDNWRPITISSILLRIVNKIVAGRLSATVRLDECQRGFTSMDGCFANNLTLQTIIKERRKARKPLTVLTLDLKKAFDSVSHSSVLRALRRFKVDPQSISLIMANFRDQSTTMYCGGEEVGVFRIWRGVKQGDPLAPILFNMVLDELLDSLKERRGVHIGGVNVSVLGYADDLLLMAECTKDAQFLLRFALRFFEARHLTLNPDKCTSLDLAVVPGKKTLFLHPAPKFYVAGIPIPPIETVSDTFKYLGHHYTCAGVTPCDSTNLDAQLGRIMRAPLKPQQKFDLVNHYLIPRYVHSMQSPSVNSKVLKKTDRQIRRAVKKILRLPVHIIDESLYTPVHLGGLGVFSFSRKIPIIMMARVEKTRRSCELFDGVMTSNTSWTDRVRKMIKPHLNTKHAVDKNNAEILERSFYGGGTRQAENDGASNFYVHSPPMVWSGEDYIAAIKLRTKSLPTRGLPYGPRESRMCRAGCGKVESLSHMLQQCPLGHTKRMNRHNFVVKRIVDAARKKGWEVVEEPHIRDTRGRLNKPDMVCTKGAEVIVADVGVSWEAPRSLSETYHLKRATYDQPELLEVVAARNPGRSIRVLPFIIGARGFWCRESSALLQALSIDTTPIRRDLVMTTLRGGWSIHKDVSRRAWD